MLKGLGDIGNLMKMQKEMRAIQKRLKSMESCGESPGSDVKVVINGEYRCLSVSIDKEFLASHEHKKVEKMVLAAINDAVDKVKQQSASEMSELAGAGGMDNMADFLK